MELQRSLTLYQNRDPCDADERWKFIVPVYCPPTLLRLTLQLNATFIIDLFVLYSPLLSVPLLRHWILCKNRMWLFTLVIVRVSPQLINILKYSVVNVNYTVMLAYHSSKWNKILPSSPPFRPEFTFRYKIEYYSLIQFIIKMFPQFCSHPLDDEDVPAPQLLHAAPSDSWTKLQLKLCTFS